MSKKALLKRCPRFISCVTPCFYGYDEYHFITHTCLTNDWVDCVSAPTWRNDKRLIFKTFGRARDGQFWPPSNSSNRFGELKINEDPMPCSRLEACLKKKRSPIEEYQELACRTSDHVYCIWYYIWDRSGSDPDDPMEDTAIHGEPLEETLMRRILGKD